MTAQGFFSSACTWRAGLACEASGSVHGRGLRRAAHVSVACFSRPEKAIYRIAGVDEQREGDWKRYVLAVLLVNFIGFIVVYLLQRLQGVLPLNPQGFGAVSADSSFNTAVSFATNTNWQGYVGEATMSYLTQMLGLAVQNFLSAASGMAVLVALIRGFARRQVARSATSGSISRAARCTSCCRCRSCSQSC